MISQSGVLGYQSGSGLLLLAGVAFTAQTGGTFPARLPARALGRGQPPDKEPATREVGEARRLDLPMLRHVLQETTMASGFDHSNPPPHH